MLMIRVVVALLLIPLCGSAGIVLDGLRDDVQVSDVGIVLGSKVMPDGTPSARLQARLDKAAELYRQGMFKHVIVSGGSGVEGFSEAKVMAGVRSRATPSYWTSMATTRRRRPGTARSS